MKKLNFRRILLNKQINFIISLSVFALLILYTYALLFVAPYSGFSFNPSSGRISNVYVETTANSLIVGDMIERIGSITWADYHQDRKLFFFKDMQPGEVVEIVVIRGAQQLSFLWIYPGFNSREFNDRFINTWWLAFVFWVIGTATHLYMAPGDTKWFLFVASNYLLGFFLIFGAVSSYHIWGSSLLLHFVTWLIFAVVTHFHWLFPTPLKSTPNFSWIFLYIVCLLLAVGEIFQLFPRSLYAIAFIASFLGSVTLLFVHLVINLDNRKEIVLLLLGGLLAFLPTLVNAVVYKNLMPKMSIVVSNISFVILPSIYFYVLSYGRLDNILRMRAIRIISVVTFLLVLGTILMLTTQLIDFSLYANQTILLLGFFMSLLVAFFTILFYPRFQTYLEKDLLDINSFIYKNIQEISELDKLKLDVFLCHSSSDKVAVREIYKHLSAQGWINPWLDEVNLLPGQDWDMVIERAVESTDAVLVCLSKKSINKEGYIHKEIRKALDVSDRKPEGTIFVIPLRLEECEVPRRLSKWQWVNYFEVDAYEKILKSLFQRFQSIQNGTSKT